MEVLVSSSTVTPSKARVTPTPTQPKPNYVAAALVVVLGVIAAVFILRMPAMSTAWQQNYDPTGHWFLSTIIAAIPIIVLLGTLALGHVKAH